MRSSPARRTAWLWATVALFTLSTAPLWGTVMVLLPPCRWREWTGWPCPTCGGGRAMIAITRGHILDAVAWNPMVTAGALCFLALGLTAPIWLGRFGPEMEDLEHLSGWRLAVSAVAAVSTNWIYLLIAGV